MVETTFIVSIATLLAIVGQAIYVGTWMGKVGQKIDDTKERLKRVEDICLNGRRKVE